MTYGGREFLSVDQAASILEMSRATIYRCIQQGAPVHRWGSTGGRVRIDPAELIAWMESARVSGSQRKSAQVSVEEDLAEWRHRMVGRRQDA